MQAPAPSEQQASPSILLVSEPGVDGVFQYVRNLTEYLQKTGWQVHLAYSSLRSGPALFDLVRQVEARGGLTLDLRVSNSPRPQDAWALVRLASLARRAKPEVIHAHSSKAGALARALPLLGIKARYFYTPHAYFGMNEAMSAKKFVFGGVERALGHVGTTISVSGSEANYARQTLGITPERLCVVSSGVDCERFSPVGDPAKKRQARAHFGLPLDALLFGTVARYTKQKDPLTLYRAVLSCLEQHPALCFAHLGKGEMSGQVDALLSAAPLAVRSRVYRIESSADPGTFYRALDAFTLPSRYEGFALSALEALATGLPLILTDCPGNNDLKVNGLDGIRWVPVGDETSLAREINDWASSPMVANNHRQTAVDFFSAVRNMEKIMRCYASYSQ